MKSLLAAILLLLAIAGVVFGVRTMGARDETDTVTAQDAARLVDDDDTSSEATSTAPGTRPKPGTYRYTGSGRDSIDVLDGSEHVLPEQIATVVELSDEDDCAWTLNIVLVKQHVIEHDLCSHPHPDGRVIEQGTTRTVEFFNQTQSTELECGRGAVWLRPSAKIGTTWRWTCTAEDGDTTSSNVATFRGTHMRSVGGERREAYHVSIASTLTGNTTGHGTSEYWLDHTGLPLRFSSELALTTHWSVLGNATYHEQYDYTLQSLLPDPAH